MTKNEMKITVTLTDQDGNAVGSNQFSEDERKHLEFIEATVTRMNTNSLKMKGWAVTLVSALLGFAATTKVPVLCLVAIIPSAMFGYLDAYYLSLERSFRDLYKAAINHELSNDDLYTMDFTKITLGERSNLKSCIITKSICPFYIILGICSAIGFFYMNSLDMLSSAYQVYIHLMP